MKHRKAVFQEMKADIASAPVSLAVGPWGAAGLPAALAQGSTPSSLGQGGRWEL